MRVRVRLPEPSASLLHFNSRQPPQTLHDEEKPMNRPAKSAAIPTLDSPMAKPAPPRAFFGLFDRKERWSLSWRGRLLFASAFVLLVGLFLRNVYPFLATTQPVNADVLVVEGWVHQYAIQAAVREFRSGSYKRVLTTGGPVVGIGGYINDFQTSASVGADLLRKAGVPSDLLQMVPSREIGRDRTYSSALAVRDWIREHRVSVRGINVVTENTHARRTWLLFRKVFGNAAQVGIVAVLNPDYDANRWWRYSEGLKDVVSESACYLYAKFLFAPFLARPISGRERYSERGF
jgi:uncharacterized SAM-binding protein YcdF (DUF218 family)